MITFDDKDLGIIRLTCKDLGIRTLISKDLDIITFAGKNLDIITITCLITVFIDQSTQAISHHIKETTIYTI